MKPEDQTSGKENKKTPLKTLMDRCCRLDWLKLRDLYLLLFTIIIGVLAASGALVFRTLIEVFQSLFWSDGGTFLDQVISSPWWLVILVPTAAGLLVGPLITYVVPEARGPGIPEVIFSVAARQSTIRHRVTLLKAFVTSLLIGGGASVGREGPIVQIGASVGSSIAQLFRFNPQLRRVCLASGAAAGISATFNAPIAGTFFAIEIILMDIEVSYITHIIISAIIASILSRMFWGSFPTFEVGNFSLTNFGDLNEYLLLGILAGFVAIGFVWTISVIDSSFQKSPVPNWLKPAVAGLFLGLIGLKLPHVLGVGYESMNMALAGSLGLWLALFILIGKTLATSLCVGAGMSGGIFAPSLVLGAVTGTLLAAFLQTFFPGLGVDSGQLALAGMGALVAGTTLAPMTAVLTIFELTYNYSTILPLLVCCITSVLVVKLGYGYSVYEMKLLKKGINIVRGHDVSILRSLRINDFMSREFDMIKYDMHLPELVDLVARSSYPHFVVVNREEELMGVLSLRDLKPYLGKEATIHEKVMAKDIMTKDVRTISSLDTMEKALGTLEQYRISFLPVTAPEHPDVVLGILTREQLLQAYNERVLKDRILSKKL